MPRQLITIAFVLTIAALTLPACTMLPNEPWMRAWPKKHCTAEQQEQVRARVKSCPGQYIPRYCEGAATVEICLED